jgi:hypothetical protein
VTSKSVYVYYDNVVSYTPDGTYGGTPLAGFDDTDVEVYGIAALGSDVYVSGYNAHTGQTSVTEYDSANGAVLDPSMITGLSGGNDLAVSSGDLFVSNNSSSFSTQGSVSEYTPGGTFVRTLASDVDVTGLAASGNDVFVNNDGSIVQYDATTGNVLNTISAPETGSLAISGNLLFVANDGVGSVEEYTTSGTELTGALVSNVGSGSIALAATGNYLFTDSSSGTSVSRYTLTGTSVTSKVSTYVGDVQPLSGGVPLAAQGVVAAPTPVTPTTSTSTVSAGASYASATAPVTATGGYATTISLAGGTAPSNTSQSVTLASTTLGGNFANLASDVFSVSGNAGSVFTVQLTFNLAASQVLGGPDSMILLWLNPANNVWVNAVVGNTGQTQEFSEYIGSFQSFEQANGITDANLSSVLGAYGVDPTTDTTWAVIDHNSDFGAGNGAFLPVAAPEPPLWFLLMAGAVIVPLFNPIPARRRL